MNLLIAAYLVTQLTANVPGNPRNADALMMTMGLETREGAVVTLRYPAYYWGHESVEEAFQLDEIVNPRMAALETNTQIRIGEARVDPGVYYLGFEILSDAAWQLVISTDEQRWAAINIPIQQEDHYIPFLSFVFTPGITDRDFLVNGLFGYFSCTMRWVISGIPSQTIDLSDSPIDVNALRRAAGEIVPVTPIQSGAAEDRPRPFNRRAGSGAFRYYLNSQPKE